MFEACDSQDDGIEPYELVVPSASCVKFVLENPSSSEDDGSSDGLEGFFKFDLNNDARVTYREVMKATIDTIPSC